MKPEQGVGDGRGGDGPKVEAGALSEFVVRLFEAEGLDREMAEVVGGGFIEAELLGFRSHGVIKVVNNLNWLRTGETLPAGEPAVLSERPAVACWDARTLPGHWAMHRALEQAIPRARELGAYTMTLQRCQHVACLASTLLPAIKAGMIVLMMVSSPDEAFVSPFGGSERLFSNNPIALTAPGPGYPDPSSWPILFDVSMAITAGSQVARSARLGRRLAEPALKTTAGAVTDDPTALARGGSVMPVGGTGHGHKGHALTIMTEVLSQALAGYGRAGERPESELNSVYLQVLDPAAFCAPDAYQREIRYLVESVQGSRPDDSDKPVRVPGQGAWATRRAQLNQGVDLDPGVLTMLEPFAAAAGVPVPPETPSA